ncbi:hypothetical protein PAT3040_01942 [Paenibacillus agaridevorans]|uniref:Uncharacterized protein n=1 Tax=Paenibacillus agaridevorans TaxID=171404 RepID=A0A2R5EL84_9BACL|nr:hypothetical protein PAT3040_01942 [Paenibacillus agaridevorans]
MPWSLPLPAFPINFLTTIPPVNLNVMFRLYRMGAPVILSEEAMPAITHSTADSLRMMVKSYNDHVYIFAVNNSETTQQVTFTSEQFDNDAVVYGTKIVMKRKCL